MNLVLYGSGEFTAQVNDIDRYLIGTYGIKNIAVIPTAAGQEKDVIKWFNLAEQHFKELNVSVIRIPIFNKEDANNSRLVALLNTADWIFFSGGDPNYLLQSITDTLLWNAVLKRYNGGTLLGGSSAGAMIMGTSILAHLFKALFTNESTAWKKAYGLVDYIVLPHFNRLKKHKIIMRKLINQVPGRSQSAWMGIYEDTAILFYDEKRLILGTGRVETNSDTD